MYFVFHTQRDWETKAAESVDDILENFLGIRDLELGEMKVLEVVRCLQNNIIIVHGIVCNPLCTLYTQSYLCELNVLCRRIPLTANVR